MASVQPFWRNVTEQEITLKVWENSAPDVDTWRCRELRCLFGHVHGTADMAKVLKNEKGTIADLVERVKGGHLAEQDVLPSRTSWTKKNPTQELPYFVRDECLWHLGSLQKRQVQQGQMFAPVSLGALHDGRPDRSPRFACAGR